MADPAVSIPEGCESCGRSTEADDLAQVRRLYVVPESWDTAGSVTQAAGAEWWCFACRTNYPHQAHPEAAPEGERPA